MGRSLFVCDSCGRFKFINVQNPITELVFIKTCAMKDIYPETAKRFGMKGIYHHFKSGDKTISYPIKGAEFKTVAMCAAYYTTTGGK